MKKSWVLYLVLFVFALQFSYSFENLVMPMNNNIDSPSQICVDNSYNTSIEIFGNSGATYFTNHNLCNKGFSQDENFASLFFFEPESYDRGNLVNYIGLDDSTDNFLIADSEKTAYGYNTFFLNSTESSYFDYSENITCNIVISNLTNDQINVTFKSILSQLGLFSSSSSEDLLPKSVCGNISNIYFFDKLIRFYALSYSGLTFNSPLEVQYYSENFDSSPSQAETCEVIVSFNGLDQRGFNDLIFSPTYLNEDVHRKAASINETFPTSEGKKSLSFEVYNSSQNNIFLGSFSFGLSDCSEGITTVDKEESLLSPKEHNLNLSFVSAGDPLQGDKTIQINKYDWNIDTSNSYFENTIYDSACSADSINYFNDTLSPIVDVSNYELDHYDCSCDDDDGDYFCEFVFNQTKLIGVINFIDANKTALSGTDLSVDLTVGNQKHTYSGLPISILSSDFDSLSSDSKGNITIYDDGIYEKQILNENLPSGGDTISLELDNYPYNCNYFLEKKNFGGESCDSTCLAYSHETPSGDICCYSLSETYSQDYCVDSISSESDLDGDGVIDSEDACPTEKSIYYTSQLSVSENDCYDGIDNDCDGKVDFDDPDCSGVDCSDCGWDGTSIDLSCNGETFTDFDNQAFIAYSKADYSTEICCENPVQCAFYGEKNICGYCPSGEPEVSTTEDCSNLIDNDADGYVAACDFDCRGYFEDAIDSFESRTGEDYYYSKVVLMSDFSSHDVFGDGLDNNCNGFVDESPIQIDFEVKDNDGNPLENAKIKLESGSGNYFSGSTDAFGKFSFYLGDLPDNIRLNYEVSLSTDSESTYFPVNSSSITLENDYSLLEVTLTPKDYSVYNFNVKSSVSGNNISGVLISCDASDRFFETDALGAVTVYSRSYNPECTFFHDQYVTKSLEVTDSTEEVSLIPIQDISYDLVSKNEYVDSTYHGNLTYLHITLPLKDNFDVIIYDSSGNSLDSFTFNERKNVLVPLYEYANLPIRVQIENFEFFNYNRVGFWTYVPNINCLQGKVGFLPTENSYVLCELAGESVNYLNAIKNSYNVDSTEIDYLDNEFQFEIVENPYYTKEFWCGEDQVPVINANGGQCKDVSSCDTSSGIFGLFSNLIEDSGDYCYMDYSLNNVIDDYQSCELVDSCYSYKSEYACNFDSCGKGVYYASNEGGCEWNALPGSGFKRGVCVPYGEGINYDADSYSCEKDLAKYDIFLYENVESFNFSNTSDFASKICNAKGEIDRTCYFTYHDSKNQFDSGAPFKTPGCYNNDEINCFMYRNQSDCVGANNVSLDFDENSILTLSEDKFGFGFCRWTGDKCIKDVDGDLFDDISLSLDSDSLNVQNANFENEKDKFSVINREFPRPVLQLGDVVYSGSDFRLNYDNSDYYLSKIKKYGFSTYFYLDDFPTSVENIDAVDDSLIHTGDNGNVDCGGILKDCSDYSVSFSSSDFVVYAGNGFHNLSVLTQDFMGNINGTKNRLVYVDNKDLDSDIISIDFQVDSVEQDLLEPKLNLKVFLNLDFSNEAYGSCKLKLKNLDDNNYEPSFNGSQFDGVANSFDQEAGTFYFFDRYFDKSLESLESFERFNSSGVLSYSAESSLRFDLGVLKSGNYKLDLECADAKNKTQDDSIILSKNFEVKDSITFEDVLPYGPVLENQWHENKVNLSFKVPIDSHCDVVLLNSTLDENKTLVSNYGLNSANDLKYEGSFDIYSAMNDVSMNNFNLTWIKLSCNADSPFVYAYSEFFPIIVDSKPPVFNISLNAGPSFDPNEVFFDSKPSLKLSVTDSDYSIPQSFKTFIENDDYLKSQYDSLSGYYKKNILDFYELKNSKTGESGFSDNPFQVLESTSDLSIHFVWNCSSVNETCKYITFTPQTLPYYFEMEAKDNSGNLVTEDYFIKHDYFAPVLEDLTGDNFYYNKENNTIFYNADSSELNVKISNLIDNSLDEWNVLRKMNSFNASFEVHFNGDDDGICVNNEVPFFEKITFQSGDFLVYNCTNNLVGDDDYHLYFNNENFSDVKTFSVNLSKNLKGNDIVLFIDGVEKSFNLSKPEFNFTYENSDGLTKFFFSEDVDALYKNISDVKIFSEEYSTPVSKVEFKDKDGTVLSSNEINDGSEDVDFTFTVNDLNSGSEAKYFVISDGNLKTEIPVELYDKAENISFDDINVRMENNIQEINFSYSENNSVLPLRLNRSFMFHEFYFNGSGEEIPYFCYELNESDYVDANYNLAFTNCNTQKKIIYDNFNESDFSFDEANSYISPKSADLIITDLDFDEGFYLIEQSIVAEKMPGEIIESEFRFQESGKVYDFVYSDGNIDLRLTNSNSFKSIRAYKLINFSSDPNVKAFDFYEPGKYYIVLEGVVDDFDLVSYAMRSVEVKDESAPIIEDLIFNNDVKVNYKGYDVVKNDLNFTLEIRERFFNRLEYDEGALICDKSNATKVYRLSGDDNVDFIYSCNFTLPEENLVDGSKPHTFVATDIVGKSAEDSVKIYYDSVVPVLH